MQLRNIANVSVIKLIRNHIRENIVTHDNFE